MKKDTYKTLAGPSPESIFKDRGSTFYGYGFPVKSEEEIAECLERLKKAHAKASHICYAWQLGFHYEHYRANDDGEPNNSAGMPIYGQIKSADLTQTLVAVVRYYGGVNLGVGGLIQAYKNAAKQTLETGKSVTRFLKVKVHLHFDYALMNVVMRIIKEDNLKIQDQEMYLDCKVILAVRERKLDVTIKRFESIPGVEVSTS